MTAKDWLERGWKLQMQIQQLSDEKEKAFCLACGASDRPQGEKVQTGKNNVQEYRMVSYTDYSIKLTQRLCELCTVKLEIEEAIERIGDPLLRALLIARYINMKPWEQIAEELEYSDKWTRTGLHARALLEMEQLLQKNKFLSDA